MAIINPIHYVSNDALLHKWRFAGYPVPVNEVNFEMPRYGTPVQCIDYGTPTSEQTLKQIFAHAGMIAGTSTDTYYAGDGYEGVALWSASFTAANVNVTNNTVSFAGIGWGTADRARIAITGTPPGGLSVGTNYWIILNRNAQTVQFAPTDTGSAIDLTSTGGNFTITSNPAPLVSGQWNANVVARQRPQRRSLYNHECDLHNLEQHGKTTFVQTATNSFYFGQLDYLNRNCHQPANAQFYFHSLFYNPTGSPFTIWNCTDTASAQAVIRRHIDAVMTWVRQSIPVQNVYAIEITNETIFGGVTGGNYQRSASNVNISTDTIDMTSTGHYYANNTPVKLYPDAGGTLPGGLTANTRYFVVNTSTNSIQLSTSSSGSAINLTSQGTGTFRIYGLAGFGEGSNGGYSQFWNVYNGGIVPANRDWIIYAFEYARSQFPEYRYAINEAVSLGNTAGGKLNVQRNFVELLEYMASKGCRADVIAIQNHHSGGGSTGAPSFTRANIQSQLSEIAQYAIDEVMISEFDYYNFNNITQLTTADYLFRCREASNTIAFLIEAMASHPKVRTFCWWGLDNQQSWLNFQLASAGKSLGSGNVDVTNNTITFPSAADYTLLTNLAVRFSGTPPAPLATGTTYYVRDLSGFTFRLASTAGGTAIDLTSGGGSFNMIPASGRKVEAMDNKTAGNMLYGYTNGNAAPTSVGNWTKTAVYYKAMHAYHRVKPFAQK